MSRVLASWAAAAATFVVTGGNVPLAYAAKKGVSAMMGNPLALLPGSSFADAAMDISDFADGVDVHGNLPTDIHGNTPSDIHGNPSGGNVYGTRPSDGWGRPS